VDAVTSKANVETIDDAINKVSGFRADLGAARGRFMSASDTISRPIPAVAAASSSIRDVDIATETSKLNNAQILVQAGVAVFAQANQAPQVALKLLR
jgi:flagellin